MAGWMGFIKTPLRGVRIAWYSRARSRSLLTARVLTRVGVLESRLRFDSGLLWMFNRVLILPLRDQRQRARLVTRLQRQRRSGVRKLTFSPCQNRGSAHRRGRLREWRAGKNTRNASTGLHPSIDDEPRKKRKKRNLSFLKILSILDLWTRTWISHQ